MYLHNRIQDRHGIQEVHGILEEQLDGGQWLSVQQLRLEQHELFF